MYDKLLPLEFHGIFKDHLKLFVLEKRGLGLKYGNSLVFNLKHFDIFSMDYDCSFGLTKELAMAWTEKSINEINQGMEQISTVVQANAATAEQSAAAAEEMSAQSDVTKICKTTSCQQCLSKRYIKINLIAVVLAYAEITAGNSER